MCSCQPASEGCSQAIERAGERFDRWAYRGELLQRIFLQALLISLEMLETCGPMSLACCRPNRWSISVLACR